MLPASRAHRARRTTVAQFRRLSVVGRVPLIQQHSSGDQLFSCCQVPGTHAIEVRSSTQLLQQASCQKAKKLLDAHLEMLCCRPLKPPRTALVVLIATVKTTKQPNTRNDCTGNGSNRSFHGQQNYQHQINLMQVCHIQCHKFDSQVRAMLLMLCPSVCVGNKELPQSLQARGGR